MAAVRIVVARLGDVVVLGLFRVLPFVMFVSHGVHEGPEDLARLAEGPADALEEDCQIPDQLHELQAVRLCGSYRRTMT